jgi:alkylglycerol monooxygenase
VAGGAAVQALVGLRIMVYGVGPREMAANAAQPSLPDWYGDAIPYYAALIVLELAVARARGKALYRASDSACGVMLGLAQTLAAPWFQWLRLTTFAWVHAHLRFASLDPSLWSTYAATFASVDLAYYWMHRSAHEFHALWSAHSVHHSGEDYNLATSLRQGLHQQAFSWLFRVPVVLFVSPKVMLQHDALNVIFMFLLHTPLVGSLGPLERVFNTPSHHRMHHRPPGNCNYGGMLIVWDVIFGSWVLRRVAPVRCSLSESGPVA